MSGEEQLQQYTSQECWGIGFCGTCGSTLPGFIKFVILTEVLPGTGMVHTLADIVVVVSARDPLEALPHSQIVNLFLGRSGSLPDNRRAVPVDQREDNVIRNVFYRNILDKSPAQIKAHWSKIVFIGKGRPPQQATNDEEVKALLANKPAAIGYIGRVNLDDRVKVLDISSQKEKWPSARGC